MNIEKKLGTYITGFTFPLKYGELKDRYQPVLSRKGWLLYTALIDKAMTEESPVITFSVPEGKDAGLSAPTLRKCRAELETHRLIAVMRESTDKPFRYELLHPTNGGQLDRSEQRKKIRAALSERYPVRQYPAEESLMVIEFFLSERRQGGPADGQDFVPKGSDDSYRYFCPFHNEGDEWQFSGHGDDKKRRRAPLMMFTNTGKWMCMYEHCRHYYKSPRRARAGNGDLAHFVRAYKWHMDASRYKKAYNLTPAQTREVIAQILDADGFADFSLADLMYTTQNTKTWELVQVHFDYDAWLDKHKNPVQRQQSFGPEHDIEP